MDAMKSGTQLDHKSVVLSFEEEVGYDPELDEAIRLGELLTCSKDDVSTAAARNLDWEQFLDSHDYRYGIIAQDLASGCTMRDAAKEMQLHYSSAVALKHRMASDLREFMGDDAIADSVHVPSWRSNIMADKKRAASKADRRRR